MSNEIFKSNIPSVPGSPETFSRRRFLGGGFRRASGLVLAGALGGSVDIGGGRAQSQQRFDNGLGLTPIRGYSTWYTWKDQLDVSEMEQVAYYIVQSGLKEQAGITYFNIDDGLMDEARDSEGNLHPSSSVFPGNVLPEFIGYLQNDLGLNVGAYVDEGESTCIGRAGSLGYEDKDAASLAALGFHLVKVDDCGDKGIPARMRFTNMGKAILNTGFPIFYSICSQGHGEPWTWAYMAGNSWRTTGDTRNSFRRMVEILDESSPHFDVVGPGGFPDFDNLMIGQIKDDTDFNDGQPMIETEQETQILLWSVMASTFIIGGDPRQLSDGANSLLRNSRLTGIHQDPRGEQAQEIFLSPGEKTDVYYKKRQNGNNVYVLFNRTDAAKVMPVLMNNPKKDPMFFTNVVTGQKTEDTMHGENVPAHGAVMIEVEKAA